MKRRFKDITFRADTLRAIEVANQIIAAYEAQGYTLTLRQLYYQHVARGLIENTDKSYKNLGEIINKGRLAGLIDWSAIEDRTRSLRSLAHWNDAEDRIRMAWRTFRMDKWDNQYNRIQVWVEKDALLGILEGVCNRYDVDYFSCRGYVSQSETFTAAERIAEYISHGQAVHILHLGDHDPSGVDMTRDIIERLTMFVEGLTEFEVDRPALNWSQIQLYNPPPNFAKTTDARFTGYEKLYGDESWELDALEPAVIEQLIEDNILALRDDDRWEEKEEEEKHERELLSQAYFQWDDVVKFLEKKKKRK